MDNGRVLGDGERLFGDNKTWKGFLGMILFTSFWFTIFGLLATSFEWASRLSLISFDGYNSPFTEMFYGAWWGLGYVLFELPNSYIKRRIRIQPGTNGNGFLGGIFTFVDQADSVVGCLIFMLLFYTPGVMEALLFFIIATVIHYIVNILLYMLRLKKQAG